MSSNLVIVGGGAMGSSIAYFYAKRNPSKSVVVIERDPTYSIASSALSTSSLRQQFSDPLNIQLSRFGYSFMTSDPDIEQAVSFNKRGYLFLGNAAQKTALAERTQIAREHGVKIKEYEMDELSARFPWLSIGDLAYAAQGETGEGWFDGYCLMQHFKSKARDLGVKYIKGNALSFEAAGDTLTSVVLEDGEKVEGQLFVNAAGAWSKTLAASIGLDIPVAARRRTAFLVSCPTPITDFPVLLDTTGVYVRPEQHHFILNASPLAANDHDDLPLDPDFTIFEEHMWPALADRIKAFESLRVERAWAGYYEFNHFDHNGLVGQFGPTNHFVATGFSGHGLMQSPGVGNGMAELLSCGGYETIDLSRFTPNRYARNEPVLEKAVY